MKFRIFCAVLILCFYDARGQERDSIHYWRLGLVSAGTAGVFYYGYGLVNNMWWKRDRSPFHFTWSADLTYAKNADKLGHIFFPYLITNTYTDLLRWTGLSERSSVHYAALLGLSYETFIEVRDGFSKKWGFSWADYAADVFGAGFPVLKYYYPSLRDYHFKISFLPSPRFKQNSHAYIIDDYESTYHWLVVRPRRMLPASIADYMPPFLALAAGHSLKKMDEPWGGEHEFFLSLDWDLEGLPFENKFIRGILRFLNHYHLPAPAVRLYPSVIWYGLKF